MEADAEQWVARIVARLTENPIPLMDGEEINRVAHVIFSSEITKAYLQGILDQDQQQFTRVQDLALALLDAVIRRVPEAEHWTIDAHVLAMDAYYAFSCGAGRVAITESLAGMLTDDEVSSVLAHEFAHSILQHPLKMSSVAQCTEEALDSVPAPIQELVRSGVEKALKQPLRHEFELEADALSLQILAESGIDPTAAITAMQKLADLEQKQANHQAPPDQMRHPPASDRLAMLKKALPAAVLTYQIHYAQTE